MLELKDVLYNVVIKRSILAKAIDDNLVTNFNYNPRAMYTSYRDAYNKTDTIVSYSFSVNELARFTDDPTKLNQMLKNKDYIYIHLNKMEIEELLNTKRASVLKEYVEYNEYYRMLMGLPRMKMQGGTLIEDEAYFVYLPKDVKLQGVDNTIPLHRQPALAITTIINSGELDKLIVKHPTFQYLHFLGKGITPFQAREANEFDIIYSNNLNKKVVEFVDHYRGVRNNFLVNYYSEYDALKYTFYEGLQCVNLIMTTIANVNAYIPRHMLDSTVIEEKYIYDLFTSYGVPKWNFSTEHLQKLAYKLNILMRKKGSKQVLKEISDMFNEITIFKYFLYKKLKPDVTDLSVPAKDKYDLYYVKTPIMVDDPYEYLHDPSNLIPFGEVVNEDPKWGDEEGNKFENELLEKEHTWTEGKYISLNNKIDLITYSFEMSHFVRYVIEHEVPFKDITFYIDTADYRASLFEVITYLQCLIFRKLKISPDIPDTMSSVVYIYGIKYNIDLEYLKDLVKERFKYTEYSSRVKKILDNFIQMLDGKRYTIGDILDAFETNYVVLEELKKFQREVTDVEHFKTIDAVIKAISYSEKLPELYNYNTNLETFLGSYTANSIKLIQRMDELASTASSGQTEIPYNSEISEVINILRSYVNKARHKHVANILDTTQTMYSDYDLLSYIETIIEFFKSYTQDLLSKGVEYMIHDISEGLKITEKLIEVIEMEDWEQITFQILFTGSKNEVLRQIAHLFYIRDFPKIKECLTYVEPRTRNTKILYRN